MTHHSEDRRDRAVPEVVRTPERGDRRNGLAAYDVWAEHDLMWRVWGLVGGIGHDDEKVHKLTDPDVRRRIVPVIHKAREKDAEAADHIERALANSVAMFDAVSEFNGDA
jgi:hypothetical protein